MARRVLILRRIGLRIDAENLRTAARGRAAKNGRKRKKNGEGAERGKLRFLHHRWLGQTWHASAAALPAFVRINVENALQQAGPQRIVWRAVIS